jgi:hypothetical protein
VEVHACNPALGRLRKENLEFKNSQGYIVSLIAWTTKNTCLKKDNSHSNLVFRREKNNSNTFH